MWHAGAANDSRCSSGRFTVTGMPYIMSVCASVRAHHSTTPMRTPKVLWTVYSCVCVCVCVLLCVLLCMCVLQLYAIVMLYSCCI